MSLNILIKTYLKTGRKNEKLYDAISEKNHMIHNKHYKGNFCRLFSLANEDDITSANILLQVNRTHNNIYTVAIHAKMSYVLFEIVFNNKQYTASIMSVIAYNMENYKYICEILLPNLFMEFMIYPLQIVKSSSCECNIINKG